MPDHDPSSAGSPETWIDSYTPPKDLEGLKAELAVHHSGRRVGIGREQAGAAVPPDLAEIDAARGELSRFFSTFFADPHNQELLRRSRSFFHLGFDEAGIPQLPPSNDAGDWYEVRALLRSFGLLSRVERRRVDLKLDCQHNAAGKKPGHFLQQLPSTRVMEVVQTLADAVTF